MLFVPRTDIFSGGEIRHDHAAPNIP